jgi:hypothetical protein
MEQSGMMRCRPGIVTNAALDTIPDQRRTTLSASKTRVNALMVLRRIRETGST